MSSFNARTHFSKSCDSRPRIIWFSPVAMLIESENWTAKIFFQGFFVLVEGFYELSLANNVAYHNKYDCTRLFKNFFQVKAQILLFF